MEFVSQVKKELEEVEEEIFRIIPSQPWEVYGPIIEFMRRGGKRVRPVLTLMSCLATGENPKKAVKIAALIEIFHNFTLIHDDIEDDSQMRRGEPTLNVKFGTPIALNSGDAIYTVIWKELSNLDEDPKKIIEMQRAMSTAFLKVVEGQGIELGWYNSKNVNISENEYYEMVNGKTGALLGLSCEMGANIAGADDRTRKILREFGEKIGIAFQIQDDVLNVCGEFEKYKKEIGGDITEGKRTLMIAKTFEKADKDEKKELEDILLAHTTSKKQISRVIFLFKKYGATEYAIEQAKKIINEAKGLLSNLPQGEARCSLEKVADFFINREV